MIDTIKKVIMVILSILVISQTRATDGKEKFKWVIENPMEQNFFIENKGQFDKLADGTKHYFDYGVDNLGSKILFNNQGITIQIEKVTFLSKEEVEIDEKSKAAGLTEKEKEELIEKSRTTKSYSITKINWINSNSDVEIIHKDPTSDYHNYAMDGNPENYIHNAKAYKKIIYKNLYNKIDVEYYFHKKGGIKYNLIVHPGGNVSDVKMVYSSEKGISKDKKGNLIIPTEFGDIVDHSPYTYYDANKKEIKSFFALNGNEVTFSLENYDKTKKIIIDPWLVNPNFTSDNKAFDVEGDVFGNTYVYGGENPYKLKKFDPSGTLLWTTNNISNNQRFGDLALAYATGVSYITTGLFGSVTRINTDGTLVFTNSNICNSEYWSIHTDCDGGRVVVTASFPVGGFANIDTATGACSGLQNIASGGGNPDFRAGVWAPNGNFYAIQTHGNQPHKIWGVDANFTTLYSNQAGFTAPYNNTLLFSNGPSVIIAGYNGIAADDDYLYLNDGAVIYKKDILTGANITNTNILGGGLMANNGIAVDGCGDIYVGSQIGLVIYDSTFTFVDSITTNAVYDVTLAPNNDILVSGFQFVARMDLNACSLLPLDSLDLSVTHVPDTCGDSTATATVHVNGNGSYTYQWDSNAGNQTDSTAVGLGAGVYTVTVFNGGACSSDTISVTVTEVAGFTTDTTTASASCGLCNGTATVSPNGAIPPLTYAWDVNANSQTTPTATGLCEGSFNVTITDSIGCSNVVTVAIVDPTPPQYPNLGPDTLLCEGEVLPLDAGAGSSYFWNTTETTQQVVAGSSGEYYVVMQDANGCDVSDTITLSYSLLELDLGPDRSKCSDESVLLDAGTSGSSYQWSSGETTQVNYVGTPGVYMVTVGDGGRCTKSDTVKVSKASTPFAEIQARPGTCEEVVLDATDKEGLTYAWNTGEESHSITVTEDGKYWVEIDNGECKNSDTAQVIIEYTEIDIILPNVFTPNGDGSNDELRLILPPTETYDLKIYNRWGRLMFESTDPTNNWGGGDSPAGVYEYILVYKELCGTQETVTETGYVTLLR